MCSSDLAGGWFGKQMFSPSGGVIEFKTPLTPNRVDGVILERKGFELIVPSSCVLEVFRAHPHPEKPQNACLFAPDAAEGLSTADFDPAILLRVGIADLQLWIGCDSISEPMKCRISSAQPFVNEGAWLRKLGMFHRGGATRALPFLDGGTLAFFLRSNGDTV